MVWVTKFLSFHRILKSITKYILIAIRVVLYDHYFYTSYSKELREKVFLRFFWISELVQATWKTTTLYLVCQSCCSLFAVVKHWPGEKAQDFPWLRGLGTHLNEHLNSWIPEFQSLQSQRSPPSTSLLLSELNLPVSNYIFFLCTTLKNGNLKYFTFRWI